MWKKVWRFPGFKKPCWPISKTSISSHGKLVGHWKLIYIQLALKTQAPFPLALLPLLHPHSPRSKVGESLRDISFIAHRTGEKKRRSDYVFFQNKVVGSKKAEDAFGGKAVGHVLCIFEWKAAS
jgi:hypothetical protein